MKKNLLKYYYIAALYFCSNFAIFAQALPDETDGDTTPAAPINDWIIPGVILGCLLAFYLIKTNRKKNSDY